MFNPPKAQQEENGHVLRMGPKPPTDAVGLAYLHTKPLDPKENVHITDLSGFTLENVTGRGVSDEDLWPNDQGLLTTWDNSSQLQAKSFILTNEFKDGQPLYYAYDLAYPAMSRGDAEQAANGVKVQDHLGNPLPADKLYKVTAKELPETNRFSVRIFSSFQVQPNEDFRVTYTAFKDDRVIPAYTERLTPSLAFSRSRDLEDVILIPNRHLRYYQSEGKEVGESQVFVGSVPIRDLDHRQPVSFRYRLQARAEKDSHEHIVTTPWVYESVFHPSALSSADTGYQNGYKRLHEKAAIDIIAEFGDNTPFLDPDADVSFVVESSSDEVATYTQADGKGLLLVTTDQPTKPVPLPDDYQVQHRSIPHAFAVQVQVDDDKPQIITGAVGVIDGHKQVAGPFEGERIDVTLLRPHDPVNAYVKDGMLFVYTNESDRFYVPRFSMRTESDSQIRVIAPNAQSREENWYVRVRNGQFRRLSTDNGFHIDQYYSVPEYFRQGFDEEEGIPFKQVTGEAARVIGENRIRLRHHPLHLRKEESGDYNIEITVNGLPATPIGWDTAEGTVDVNAVLKASEDITATYFYEEHAFEYRGFFSAETDSFWHLDLNPGAGHWFTDYDEESGETVEAETFRLINRTVYLYIRPTAMFTEAREMVRGSYQENALFHSFHERKESGLVLLAKVQVRPNSTMENLTLVDTRVRGGGLRESVSADTQANKEPESRHYWDIADWDGTPYPENGVYVVRLPMHLLKEKGGRFTEADIEKAVAKHTAFGVLPVIEYIDETKEILPRPSSVSTELRWEESE